MSVDAPWSVIVLDSWALWYFKGLAVVEQLGGHTAPHHQNLQIAQHTMEGARSTQSRGGHQINILHTAYIHILPGPLKTHCTFLPRTVQAKGLGEQRTKWKR